jgi:ketosteroid isomerase-like protein
LPAQSNIELLLEGFDALSSGDEARILAFAHPEFETAVPPALSAEPDTYRGHEGIRHYFQLFDDAMEDVRFTAERCWEAGERVVVVMRLTARGKQTGILVEQRTAQVWTIRDGRALRAQTFTDLSEAFAAAGIDADAAEEESGDLADAPDERS